MKDNSRGRRCERCLFWQEIDKKGLDIGGPRLGQCRKNAPSVIRGGESVWPLTPDETWCGEYAYEAQGYRLASKGVDA